MSNLFDTAPFAYVGNNKHYKELTPEEKDKLKESEDSVVKKEPLPSSDEVEESSASVVGQMLPQVGLTETNIPSSIEMFADAKEDAELLKESLDDLVNGDDTYFEAAGFIEELKNKFKKDDVTKTKSIDYNKVMHVAKTYTTLKMAMARAKISTTKDSKNKHTQEYRELQKKVVKTEKEYRKLKKELTKDELAALNQYIDGFNSTFDKKVVIFVKDIKESKKAAIKKEYSEIITDNDTLDIIVESYNYDDEVYTEGANLDLYKRYRADVKIYKAHLKDAKKLIKANEYDDARAKVKEAIDIVEKCKKDTIAEINKVNEDDVLTAVCGFILRHILVMCRDLLLLLAIEPVAIVKRYIELLRDTINTISSIRKKGYFSVSDINTHINFIKENYDIMLRVLNHYITVIDNDEKEYKKNAEKVHSESTCAESACDNSVVVTEKNIDPEMKPILDTLHKKGYETVSSSSGHKNVIIKKDGDKDNVAEGHHYGDARLVFKGKYDFGKAPKYWYWKKVDNADEVEYLDVIQKSEEESPDTHDKFSSWKSNYMKSLTDWVNSLPDLTDTKETMTEESHNETTIDVDTQINMLFESVLDDINLDLF